MERRGGRRAWRQVRWLVLLLLVAIAYGVTGYMLILDWGFLDSLYMTVTTLTTVGYREVRELDQTGVAFTISLIAVGVGTVLVSISLVAGWIAEGGWTADRRRRRMDRRIDSMTGHYIVCAYGRVGRAVARELEAEGVPFVVVDPKESLEERMREDGVAYLTEDPTEEAVLRRAGVERARGLVSAVDSDATNVYIVLLARSLNEDLFIVARASEPGSDQRLLKAGADRVVSPYVSSGRHMALVALRPRFADVVEVESPGATSMRLEELRVEPTSDVVGRRVAEAFPGIPVLAIRHAGGQITTNPHDDVELQAGDLVLLIGEEDLPAVRRSGGERSPDGSPPG